MSEPTHQRTPPHDGIHLRLCDTFTPTEIAALRQQVQFGRISWPFVAELHFASDETSPLILDDTGE